MSNETRFGLTKDEQDALATLARKVLNHTLEAQPPEYRDGDTVLAGFEVRPSGDPEHGGILIMMAHGDAKKLLRDAVAHVANR
jgi:hypothetical protein